MKAHKKKKANAKQQPILDRKKNNKNNDNTGHNSGSSSSKRSAKHNRDNDTDATSAAAARKTKKSRTSNNLEHSQQVAELTLKTQSTSNNNSSDSCGETHVQPLTPPPSTDTTTVATSEPDATNTIPTSASNMSLEQGHPPPLQKKDKHVAVETSDDENHTTNATTTNKSATTNTTKKTRGSSSIRITTEDKVTDLNLPPTPPTSASLEDSGEVEPTADGLDDYKGCADDEWFAHMGWHFEEKSGDLNFVDSDGNLFDYEKHYDRFEFVQAEIQGLVYNRLRDKYGFQQIVVAQNESTSASNGGEYHRFPRIFVSPNIHTSTAILVLVPKGGDETPGQWSRTMFTSGEKGNILFASQFSYIDLALNEGWGVVLCDPNGGDLYDSDEYRQSHVLYVWDDILQPSQATCVMYVALGEGTDAVLSILDSSRADEFRQRVKGVALLDGTNGDKRDEKLNRVWLNKHARSFMARNGASPGRNGIKVNAANEHDLVPGFALKKVFTFLRHQYSASMKTQQQQAKLGRKKAATTTSTSNGKSITATTTNGNRRAYKGIKSRAQPTPPPLPTPLQPTPMVPVSDNNNSREAWHDDKMSRPQNKKAKSLNKRNKSNDDSKDSNSITTRSGEQPRGRGRPRKSK